MCIYCISTRITNTADENEATMNDPDDEMVVKLRECSYKIDLLTDIVYLFAAL